MQVALANKERQSMVFLGDPLNFTYDDPGPKEIDLDVLTSTQKNQLLYNCRLGILAVNDKDVLMEACGSLPAASTSFTTAHEQPIVQVPPKDAIDGAEEDLDHLKQLLDFHHSTVKKRASSLRPAQVRGLLNLELNGKKRKSVVKFLKELVEKHADSVTDQMQGIDLMEGIGIHQQAPGAQSTQVSDVVESEMKEIALIPSDEELKVSDA